MSWPSRNNNNNNNNNNGDDDGVQYDDQFFTYHAYESPLCAGAWYYKEKCNRKCRRLALGKRNANSDRNFTKAGKFFLLVFSLTGAYNPTRAHGAKLRRLLTCMG